MGPISARDLCERYGGREIHLPGGLDRDHPFARLLGLETAGRLVRALGPGRLYVPRWANPDEDRAAAVKRLTAEGLSAAAIAERLDISTRTVHRLRTKDG